MKLAVIRAGSGGTVDTITEMKKLAIAGSLDMPVIDVARNIVLGSGVNTRVPKQTADALFNFVHDEIKFVYDTYHAEMIQSPEITLKKGCGDCDDMAILLASLNMAVSNRTRFVTIGTQSPDEFSHVYIEVEVGENVWRPYDASVPDSYAGWEPEGYTVKAVWHMDSDNGELSLGRLSGVFDKIYAELRRFTRRVSKEVARTIRKIQQEKHRFFDKVAAEMARWPNTLGPFGTFLIVGVKGITLIIPGAQGLGAVLFAITQTTDNPLKMTDQELMLFANLALTVSSSVLTAFSAGAAAPLLAASVMKLASLGISAAQVADQINQRKEAIKELEGAVANYTIEARVKREAIAKLNYDIAVLDYINKQIEKHGKTLVATQKELEMRIKAYETQKANAAFEKLYAKRLSLGQAFVQMQNEEIQKIANRYASKIALAKERMKETVLYEQKAIVLIKQISEMLEKLRSAMLHPVGKA